MAQRIKSRPPKALAKVELAPKMTFHRKQSVSKEPVGLQRRNELALSSFRLLTPARKLGLSLDTKIKMTKRASSEIGFRHIRFGEAIASPFLRKVTGLSKERFEVDARKICRERKERRAVLFAKAKVGGAHKPPTFSLKSLVRC